MAILQDVTLAERPSAGWVASSIEGRFHPTPDRYARDPINIAALDHVARKVRAARNEIIYREGDESGSCFQLLLGSACLSMRLPDGRRHIVDFLFAGDFFGFSSGREYNSTAEAIERSIVARYPRSLVEAIAERNLAACNFLRLAANADLQVAQIRGALLVRLSAIERLATFFLLLADRIGDGDHLVLPMSRTDIGDYLGVTIETVSRTIGQFKAHGLISLINTRHVHIRDRGGLAELAHGGLPRTAGLGPR